MFLVYGGRILNGSSVSGDFLALLESWATVGDINRSNLIVTLLGDVDLKVSSLWLT